MRRFYLTVLSVLLPLAAKAQTSEEIISRIGQASAQMTSMECDFTQTKHLDILNDSMVSTGKMYYMQADRLRWEYTSPYEYTFILNGNQVLLRNNGRSDVIDVNRNKMFKDIARLMMESITGTCLSDGKTFQTKAETRDGQWIATLIPIKKDMKQMWSELVLHIDPDKKMVQKVEMLEASGDRTVIELRNIQINREIDAGAFEIR